MRQCSHWLLPSASEESIQGHRSLCHIRILPFLSSGLFCRWNHQINRRLIRGQTLYQYTLWFTWQRYLVILAFDDFNDHFVIGYYSLLIRNYNRVALRVQTSEFEKQFYRISPSIRTLRDRTDLFYLNVLV